MDMEECPGMIVEEGNTLEETESIQQVLENGEWKDEALQIPLEYLKEADKKIVEDYLQGKAQTVEDINRLQELLAKYRPAIQKIQPKQTIQNLNDNQQLVNDENEFLRLVDEYDTIQTIYFNYPLGDKILPMKFDVYPITDSQAILNITDNLTFFKDLNDEEMNVYSKIQNHQKLSHEETLIQHSLNKKIEKATQENQKETIVEFLSMQLKFHGKDSSYESMKQVFNRMQIAYLALLFQRVQEMNHLGDMDVERLFHKFD